jgi:hypothetical protein
MLQRTRFTQVRVFAAVDLTQFDAVSVQWQTPSRRNIFTVTPTIGNTEITVDGVTWPANQWVAFTPTVAQTPETGDYTVQLIGTTEAGTVARGAIGIVSVGPSIFEGC